MNAEKQIKASSAPIRLDVQPIRFGSLFSSIGRVAIFSCCATLLSLVGNVRLAARHDDVERGIPVSRRPQRVVDALRMRLSIPEPVLVSVVPTNPLLVSVEAPKGGSDPFRLTIEAAFLETLTDEELEAVLAHELGHVWIFTHHPYLQTEPLANQIALRVVSRTSLEHVYQKMWRLDGTDGQMFMTFEPDARPGLIRVDSNRPVAVSAR